MGYFDLQACATTSRESGSRDDVQVYCGRVQGLGFRV